MRHIPIVESVDRECQLMGTCICGGDWKLTYNEVALRSGVWVDYIIVRCADCGLGRLFEFDVSRFFSPRPGIWASAPVTKTSKVVRLTYVQQVTAGTSMTFVAVA